ncbi:LuxR C-terminal-related transcriptional regulator, partial [Streptomyces sp. NPDC058534]|uniref:LuxR C-terminal-related transcriptional regulator n=1 Tax=Streptomyces sp. NPDC058534 TaxID=3346541 RepID=UPI003650547D
MDGGQLSLEGLALAVYERCLRRRDEVSVSDLALSLDAAEDAVGVCVDGLVEQGLVRSGSAGSVVALPPRTAFSQAALRLEAAAEQTRQQGLAWQRVWAESAAAHHYLDVLTDPEDIERTERAFVDSARSEVRALHVGPVGPPRLRPPAEIPEGTFEALDRGVAFKVVYSSRVFTDPVALTAIESCIARGEEARVFAEIPVTLNLADDTVGIVTVPGSGDVRRHAIVVHPSGFLDSLAALFDCFWRMGVPLTHTGDALESTELDDAGRRLLMYLGAGLTDDAIAREMRVSERTVGRRVARLQERLGTRSRFQLAALAAGGAGGGRINTPRPPPPPRHHPGAQRGGCGGLGARGAPHRA